MLNKKQIIGTVSGVYTVGTMATLNSMDIINVAPLDVGLLGALVGVVVPNIPMLFKWYKSVTSELDEEVNEFLIPSNGEYKTIRGVINNLAIDGEVKRRETESELHYDPSKQRPFRKMKSYKQFYK